MKGKGRTDKNERRAKLKEMLAAGPVSLRTLTRSLKVDSKTIGKDIEALERKEGLKVNVSADGYGLEEVSDDGPGARPFLSTLDGDDAVPGPPIWKDLLRELYSALYSRRKVVATIALADEEEEEMVLHPHFLAHFPESFYLFAAREEGGLVNIPLAKLLAVRGLNESFRDIIYYEYKIRYREGWVPRGSDYAVTLRFPATAAWASGLRMCCVQEVEYSGGDTVISFRTDDLECVSRLAVFLGSSVKVEKPSLLKSLIDAHRLGALRVYRGAATRRAGWITRHES